MLLNFYKNLEREGETNIGQTFEIFTIKLKIKANIPYRYIYKYIIYVNVKQLFKNILDSACVLVYVRKGLILV